MRLFALCQDEVPRLRDLQEELGLAVTVLADPDGQAIEAFGMRDPAPVPPRPMARAGTFLVDREGVVRARWLPAHYHQRPTPDDLLERLP